MTTTTLTLAAFLEARLAEDEAAALAASPAPWSFGGVASVAGGTLYDATRRIADVTYEQPEDHDGRIVRHLLSSEADANGTHITRQDPARVLAEVAAKRAVMGLHQADLSGDTPDEFWLGVCGACGWAGLGEAYPCRTLRHLAAIYSDHPDYDPSWAVS